MRSKVRKSILCESVLVQELKEKYADTNGEKQKQILSKIIKGKLLRKYRLMTEAKKLFGYSRNRHISNAERGSSLEYERKQSKRKVPAAVRKSIREFYTRDDNRRITADKKDTVTRMKLSKEGC